MRNFIKAPKDVFAGLMFLAIAAVFASGMAGLSIGTAFRMGAGYFPMVLTILLAVLATVLIARGLYRSGEQIATFTWRGLLFVTGPVVFFATTLSGLGLVPSLGATILAVTFASRVWEPKLSIAVTAILVLFCVVVFVYGLGLPLMLFGPWVGGH